MSILIQEHLSKLGFEGKDRVTGFTGVISSVGFDLYGCIQVTMQPKVFETKEGKMERQEGMWFDINRIEITGKKPVMEVPNFYFGPVAEGKKGAAEKPSPL